jgi:VanZ family protein
MLPLDYPGRWQLAGLLLLLSILMAAVLPAFLFPRIPIHAWFGLDKWMHALAFAFLAVWFAGQYRRQSYWRIAVGLAAFGILIELFQSAITYRSAEWYDFVADLVGIMLGLVIALAGAGGWSQRFEGWLRARSAA